MRRIPLASLAVAAALGLALVTSVHQAPPAAAEASTFTVDSAHSTILFRVSHMGVGAQYGRFNDFEGTFALDGDNPKGCSVNISVDAASIDTGNADRDKHLRAPDMFNVAQFPKLTFQSTSVAATTSSDRFDVYGKLTMHGVTQDVNVRVRKLGEKDGGERFGYRAGFEGTFTIMRSDYGMAYGVEKGMIGDAVQITLALEGVKK